MWKTQRALGRLLGHSERSGQVEACHILKQTPVRNASPGILLSRGAQMEAQYQAPVVTPPTSALALRTYEEEPSADTEQRRLLPKWSEQSAPLRADETGAASTSAQSITGHHATGTVGLTTSASSNTSKPQQHRRTGSGSDIVRPPSAQGRPHAPSRHRKGQSLSASELAGKGAISDAPAAAQVSVAQDDDDSDFCPTCLEPYTEENPKTHTACGHHYHLPCLYEWLERSDTCPTCMSPLQFNGM